MPSLLNFVPHAVGQPSAQIVYAEVTTPAPASFEDPLFVVMPDWSVEFPIEITDWLAAHGNTLPLPGNAAVLVVDTRGNTRCVWWDGQMTFATQHSQAYYLTTAASDVASHIQMTSEQKLVKATVPITSVMSGTVLLDYMTQPGIPGVTFLPSGQFEFHIHAAQTAGNQAVQIYAQFWEYDPIGMTHVAMIGQTQASLPLTFAEIEYRLFFALLDPYTFVSRASRISVHVLATVGGTGGANIAYYVGGTADSHVIIPVGNLAPVTSTNYTVATQPAATAVPPGTIVFVSDGGGGAQFQGSTGSAWVNLG